MFCFRFASLLFHLIVSTATIDPITIDPITTDPITIDPITIDPITMALSVKQTSMTLSERFRILRAQTLSREQSLLVGGSDLNVVDVSIQPVRGSFRNQKLANQLASRPAALRLKNRSIKQRLGIKNRLGPPVSSFDTYESPGYDYGTPILAMDQVSPPRPYVQSTYHHGNQSTFNRFGGWRRFSRGNFRPYFGQR